MDIASLVLGIVALLGAWIAFLSPAAGVVMLVISLVGVALGVVSVVRSRRAGKKASIGIAGIIVNGIAALASVAALTLVALFLSAIR